MIFAVIMVSSKRRDTWARDLYPIPLNNNNNGETEEATHSNVIDPDERKIRKSHQQQQQQVSIDCLQLFWVKSGKDRQEKLFS